MDKLLVIIGILVVSVNIITEVVKNCSEKLSSSKVINVFVTCLSVILSVICYFFYVHFDGIPIDVYGIIASIVVGFMVAFAAMFGFDKLIVYIEPFLKGGE